MFTPFLESFPDDFSIQVDGQTYSAVLVTSDAPIDDDTPLTETAQPAKRRYTKKQSHGSVPRLILTRTADVTKKCTMTRTRRALK